MPRRFRNFAMRTVWVLAAMAPLPVAAQESAYVGPTVRLLCDTLYFQFNRAAIAYGGGVTVSPIRGGKTLIELSAEKTPTLKVTDASYSGTFRFVTPDGSFIEERWHSIDRFTGRFTVSGTGTHVFTYNGRPDRAVGQMTLEGSCTPAPDKPVL